jgi:hypothetical protein
MSLREWVEKSALRQALLQEEDDDEEGTSSVPPLVLLCHAAITPKQRNTLSQPFRQTLSARQHLWEARRATSHDPLAGVPRRPLLRRLEAAVAAWVERGHAPRPPVFFPGEFSEEEQPALPFVTTHEEAVAQLTESRVAQLLQMRKTAGTQSGRLPPSWSELLRSFRARHAKGGEGEDKKKTTTVALTVGGRALTKHAQRSSEGYWGESKGTAAAINANAEAAVVRVMREAVWMNLHILPDDLAVFEARVAEGYGARWVCDAQGNDWTFRGYLEPPTAGGHESGWRH